MNENYIPVATKISEYSYKRLKRLCKKLGMKKYEILQGMVDTLLRYTDDRHNLTSEMEMMMSVFEHLQGWKDAFRFCNPSAQPIISRAIYFISDESGKHGLIPVMVDRPFFSQWTQTLNLQEILEETICTTAPELYRKLRRIGVELGTNSIVETLLVMTDEFLKESEVAELRKPFEDNDRGDFGQKPHDGGPYKRKMTKDIESPEFDFRPLGYEE